MIVRVPLLVIIFVVIANAVLANENKINECGRLSYFWNECWVFAPFCGGKQYLLRDNQGFESFDIVRVQGVSGPCYVRCGGAFLYYCINSPEITLCEPESLGCGVLREIISPDCHGIWLWESLEWGKLELGEPYGFADGDVVFAAGFINRTCGQICMFGEACLVEASLSFCNSPKQISNTTWGRVKFVYR